MNFKYSRAATFVQSILEIISRILRVIYLRIDPLPQQLQILSGNRRVWVRVYLSFPTLNIIYPRQSYTEHLQAPVIQSFFSIDSAFVPHSLSQVPPTFIFFFLIYTDIKQAPNFKRPCKYLIYNSYRKPRIKKKYLKKTGAVFSFSIKYLLSFSLATQFWQQLLHRIN